MRDIKIRQAMDEPKALAKHFAPKDTTSLQQKKLEQQKAAKEPESRGGVRYATDKAEHGLRNSALLAAGTTRRVLNRNHGERKANAVPHGRQKTAQYARIFMQRKAQRKMLQTTVRERKNAARKLGGILAQAGKTVGRAAVSMAGSVAAFGGGVVLVLCLAVILIAAIVASPFGIFFSSESQGRGTVPISAVVAQINDDFNAEIENIKASGSYDFISVTGQAADWAEVLAVFAVKTAGCDTDGVDVVEMDADRIARLNAVFWDMTTIEHRVEVIHHSGDGEEESWTERNLYITIAAKTAEEMKTAYHFNRNQIAALEELLAQRDLLVELMKKENDAGTYPALMRSE